MDIGIAVCSSTDSWKVVARAEELGFTHAWFYDTQLLCADVFVAMAAAAMKTSRIRLGTGVLIPSNRIAPVTANAFASLNKLAPGRIDFGVGTGFTGRRTMGLRPLKLQELTDYVAAVCGLLEGRTLACDLEGEEHLVRFLNPDLDLINIDDPVRLHISAFGPKSRALVAARGAGWCNMAFTERTGTRDIERMQQSWADAGRAPSELYATAFTLGCVLEAGEAYDSPRAMAQAGPSAAVFLHSVVEQEALNGKRIPLPDWQRELVDRYHAVYREYTPAEAPYLTLHRGHMMFVRPDEAPMITAELIRAKSSTGTAAELRERFERWRDAGYSQVAVQLIPGQEQAIEDWAPILRSL